MLLTASPGGPVDIYYLLGALAVLVGLIGGVAGVVAYFRAQLGNDTISTLEKNNTALKERVDLLEREAVGKDKTIATLTARVDTLLETMTHSKTFEQLNEASDKRQTLIERQLNEILKRVSPVKRTSNA
jgi:predicted RNase H-like nuclease (RuvC/YqgF family)